MVTRFVVIGRIVGVVFATCPRPAIAVGGTPADVFGVDLRTPMPLLGAITKGTLPCREFAAPKRALVCQGSLRASSRPGPESTTFWIVDDRVSRIYEVTRPNRESYAEPLRQFQARAKQIETILGRPPTLSAVEPDWVAGREDGMKLFLLGTGKLQLKAVWSFPGRDLSVSLHGDKGAPVLVVGLEASSTGPCDPQNVASMLMDLFPPAPAAARERAAKGLTACGVTGAAGALAAAAAASPEKEVKVEAVRALAGIGSAGRPLLEEIAKDSKLDAAVEEARGQLAKADKTATAAEPPKPRTIPSLPDKAASSIVTAVPPVAPVVVAPPRIARTEPARATPPSPPPTPSPATPPMTKESKPVISTPPKLAAPVAAVPAPPPAPVNEVPAIVENEDSTKDEDAEPEEAEAPAAPPEPAKPKGPPDGTILALTTSLVAGGVWGGGLSLLAQQDRPQVLLLVGSAGAVIGGGTAWGLTHFGLRPSPAQALWFTNSTAWGTMAGLLAWAGSGSDNPKLKWGLLVGGESLGMGMGVLGARLWDWTPSQILFANSLVLGAGLAGGGGRLLVHPGEPLRVSPLIGYGAAPAMIAAGLLSRTLSTTPNDLHLLAGSALATAWSGGLLAYGLDDDPATRDYRLAGGALAGMGVGYLGSALASPFVEVAPRRVWLSGAGLMAGNLIGLGSYMMIRPDETTRRPLWASLGGLGLGTSIFLAYPKLRLGSQATAMSLVGAGYAAGTWGLAMAAAEDGSATRLQGGILALGTAGGLAGLLASGFFSPGIADYPVTLASAALGASAGIGVGKLATDTTGTGEMVGTLAGSALGFAAGAVFSHSAHLRAPDFGAAALGAGVGTLAGVLAPSLQDAEWGGLQRKNQGGLLVGLPAGAFAGAAFSHLANASGGSVAVAASGAAMGLGLGLGTGLLWPEHYSQPSRIGSVAGVSAGLAAALLLERPLRLREGLGQDAIGLGAMGAAIGITEGVLLAGLVDPSGDVTQASTRQLQGGALLGGTAGLASGLLLSKYATSNPQNMAATMGGALFGGLLGRGLTMTLADGGNHLDTAATMTGVLGGSVALGLADHYSPLTTVDLGAGALGMAYGGLVGALSPTLTSVEWGGWNRKTEGGLLLGLSGGALGAVALSHVADAQPATLVVGSAGGMLGLGMGLGSGLLAPGDYSQPTRIGAVAGVSAGLVGSLLLEHPLRLHEGLGESALGMGGVGTGLGVAQGLMLADLVEPSGASQRQRAGGALLGGSAGLASGLLLSKYFQPGAVDLVLTTGGGVLGGIFGRGLAMTITSTEGRFDTASTMAGTLAGVGGLGLVQRYAPLRTVDLASGALGMAYGGLVGALAPTLADGDWGGWRRSTEGGLMLGLSGGALAAAGLSHAVGARPETLVIGSTGGLVGLGMGVGTGLLWPEGYSQPARIGAVAGVSAGVVASFLLDRPLRLREGLGESAGSVGGVTTVLGVAEGVLLAGLVDPSGQVSQTSSHQIVGGVLLGGSAGLASGLLLSKYFEPDSGDVGVTVGGAILGGLFGRGLSMTVGTSEGRADTAGTMTGVLLGASGMALVEHYSPLGGVDLGAGTAGLAFGGLIGSLAPTLADPEWGGWRRQTQGGLMLGVGAGALAAASVSHAVDAQPASIAVGSVGGLLGLGMGTGAGLLWPESYSQPGRIGAVAGVSVGAVASLLLDRRLQLHEGLDENDVGIVGIATGIGVGEGLLLAGLVQPSGEVSQAASHQLAGGALLGGTAGLASGLVLSKYFNPEIEHLAATVGGGVLGGVFGRGLSMTVSATEGRHDTAGTMAGGLAGAAGLALLEHVSPLDEKDAAAGGLGLASGALLGALAPTLAEPTWGGWRRGTEGGLLLGAGGGALAAAGLAHGIGVTKRTLVLGLAGALDGALTGAGVGMLVDQDPESTQGTRIGLVAGVAGGLGLGLGLGSHRTFDTDALLALAAASGLGGWTGGWAQVLGHESFDDVDSSKVAGGIMAGAGGASLVTAALLPALHLDSDLISNALAVDAIFSGAGAGVGALASRRADAPVWGMLSGGTAGLLLGGVLHRSIDFERSSGLLAFGGIEGLWAGAWLPYVLRPSAEVTDSDHVAGVAAGGLGGLGLSLLASTVRTPAGPSLGMAGAGSAIGAALAGGSVLLSEEMDGRLGAGIVLGGTAAGLGVGALVSTVAPLDQRRGMHMLAGAGFGAAEGLAFAWSGRATTSSQYAGSALIGAGLGASLGLASSADAEGLDMQQALVASGFSAWGGWVGSFAGAYANRDPHEVVLGGLAAANVGFLAGYGALRYDLVAPRDFGWLSLAGALGTALGGGVGAAFSSQSDPRPVLAGLSLGPVVGIGVGAFIVPRLHRGAESGVAFVPSAKVAGVRHDLSAESANPRTSVDVLAERKPSRLLEGLKLVQRHLFDVTNWTPVFGSLPPLPGDPNPAPLFVGVSGGLR